MGNASPRVLGAVGGDGDLVPGLVTVLAPDHRVSIQCEAHGSGVILESNLVRQVNDGLAVHHDIQPVDFAVDHGIEFVHFDPEAFQRQGLAAGVVDGGAALPPIGKTVAGKLEVVDVQVIVVHGKGRHRQH